MEVIDLAWWKLGLAALLILALAGTSYLARLGITRSLLIAALRTVIQLALIRLVLEVLFASSAFYWIALLAAGLIVGAGAWFLIKPKKEELANLQTEETRLFAEFEKKHKKSFISRFIPYVFCRVFTYNKT